MKGDGGTAPRGRFSLVSHGYKIVKSIAQEITTNHKLQIHKNKKDKIGKILKRILTKVR